MSLYLSTIATSKDIFKARPPQKYGGLCYKKSLPKVVGQISYKCFGSLTDFLYICAMFLAANIATPSEKSKLNFARSIAKVHLSSNHRHFHEKRISKDIVLHFLRADKMAAFRVYLHLMHDKSSKLHRSSFKESAAELGMGEANFYKLMKQLEADGFVDRKGNGWWFGRGTKQFNIANGICHAQMVGVPKKSRQTLKTLKNFCRSLQMTMAAKKVKGQQSRKSYGTEQGTPLSISYIARFSGTTSRTVCRHKKQAKANDHFTTHRVFKTVERGGAGMIPIWKEHKTNRQYIEKVCRGVFELRERLSSNVSETLFVKKKVVRYSKDERETMKSNFVMKDLIPVQCSEFIGFCKKEL